MRKAKVFSFFRDLIHHQLEPLNESKPAIFKLHAKPSTVSRLPKPLNFYDQYKTWRDLENGLLACLRYARNTNCRLTGIHCWLAFNWTFDNLSDSKSRPDYFYSFCLDYNRGRAWLTQRIAWNSLPGFRDTYMAKML